MKFLNKKASGFTLIELLVVIALIALLSSIVIASLSTAKGKAQDASAAVEVRQAEIALELYYNSNGGYPSAQNGQNVLGAFCIGSTTCSFAGYTITGALAVAAGPGNFAQGDQSNVLNSQLASVAFSFPTLSTKPRSADGTATGIVYIPCPTPASNGLCSANTASIVVPFLYGTGKFPAGVSSDSVGSYTVGAAPSPTATATPTPTPTGSATPTPTPTGTP